MGERAIDESRFCEAMNITTSSDNCNTDHFHSNRRSWYDSSTARDTKIFRVFEHAEQTGNISRFPFRINTVRTDNSHEFQAKFLWHVKVLEIRHVYIKPRSHRLNGKVEQLHGTDDREFYQLLTYKDDADPEAKLAQWEKFYNLHRPHTSLIGKTPFEMLKEKLK